MNIPDRPSARGAGIAGDDYQHLFTWIQALKLLLTEEGVTRIGLEVGGGHNVDDVVVHVRSGPPLYHQVKFVTDQREPLTHEWFTTVPGGAQRSPLQRFHDSFNTLTVDGERPRMVLETNRWPVDGDRFSSMSTGAPTSSCHAFANRAYARNLARRDRRGRTT